MFSKSPPVTVSYEPSYSRTMEASPSACRSEKLTLIDELSTFQVAICANPGPAAVMTSVSLIDGLLGLPRILVLVATTLPALTYAGLLTSFAPFPYTWTDSVNLAAAAIQLCADGVEDWLEACVCQPAYSPGDEGVAQREHLVGADNIKLGRVAEFKIVGGKPDAGMMVQLRGHCLDPPSICC